MALNIRGNDSSTRSKDAKSSDAGSEQQNNITRQALLYDENKVLINMVREVQEGGVYEIEVIDGDLM